MQNRLVRNIIRFVVVVLLQVLLFNHIEFSGYINPYFYIIFILLMPFETPGWVILTSAFLLGLSIDMFSHTLGMHSMATVFMAFMRPRMLSFLSPRDGYESGTVPRVYHMGFFWFLRYTTILVLLHHVVLFYTEIFHIQDFFSIFLRVLLSSVFSITFIVLSQFFVFRK